MIEVLKQMVEALEWCHGGEPVGTAEAIQAGKKLIAEWESQEPDVVMHWHSHTWTTINPPPKNSGDVNLYYAPPQRTEQEPVATARFDGTLHWVEPYGVGLHRIEGPLYTTPPQHTWVGLTDEERNDLCYDFGEKSLWSFADSIEAKLKEKNT